ncbi:MAG: cellulose biosynthesis protein CelD [Rhizobiales bacterium]|nr:cellulose biosynthesis protein CelD [Hyphomicrobiales bacterium]
MNADFWTEFVPEMVHVDDINGRRVISAKNSLTGAYSVGHVRLSARLIDRIEKAESVWRAMEAAPHVTLHQTYDWCRAWAAMPGVKTLVVLVSLDGRPAVLLPLEIVRRFGVRVARLIGTRHSNHNAPVYSARFLEEADRAMMEDLVETLRALNLPADVLALDKLRPMTGDRPEPFLVFPSVTSQNPSFQLPLKNTFEATLAQINAKRRRKKFRPSERRLEPFGGYRRIEARDDASAERLLRAFFAQKSLRLAEQGLPDVFAEPGVHTVFGQLAGFADNDGKPVLTLHGIEIDDGGEAKLLAIAGLTRKDGHVTCQFGSVDDRTVPDASAGELLFYLMIEELNADGADVFDFGVGDQRYKRSWCPVETPHADVFLPLRGRGTLAAGVMAASVRAKRFVKTSPQARKFADRIRALLNSKKPASEDAG